MILSSLGFLVLLIEKKMATKKKLTAETDQLDYQRNEVSRFWSLHLERYYPPHFCYSNQRNCHSRHVVNLAHLNNTPALMLSLC